MKRIGVVGLCGAILLLAVLASRPKPASTPVEPRRPDAAPPATAEIDPGPGSAAALVRQAEQELLALCEERDRLAERKSRLQKPAPPTRPPDDHYRRAERCFQEGDFVGAIAACEEAIKLDAAHPPARALLKEARFHLENLRAPSTARDVAGAAVGVAALEDALVRSARHIRRGELDAAERECLKILDYLKALPADAAARDLEAAALDQLDRIRAARR